MIDNYPYSRNKIAETTADAKLASPKRRIAYVLAGILIAAAGSWLINYLDNLNPEQVRTLMLDTLLASPFFAIICFIGSCIGTGWTIK